MEITCRVISREGEGKRGGKDTGNKQHKWQVQKRQGEIQNSVGDGEAQELICTTHGHELMCGNDVGRGGTGTWNKQHKWQVQNRQGKIKNSLRNVEAKELICTTHGHELKAGNAGGRGCVGWKGIKWGETVIASSIKYIF